ncbi:MAG: hypothetical protein CV088_08800 [Nitrospira sp. LK70]|nr:hypothetical protein [Nitrospira sp. LK70]
MPIDPKRLAVFLREAEGLRKRVGETPLPIAEHNAWVDRMSAYFAEQDAEEYLVRLSDFSGMTFYGDGSERSRMSNSIDGRSRRLHEFIKEISGAQAPLQLHQAPPTENPIFILKPSFFGFGIDLRAGWKKVAKWLWPSAQ